MVLYVVNAQITPFSDQEATFHERKITIEEAKELVKNNVVVSAIGHETTARVLSQLLGVTIPTNRQQVFMEVRDKILAFVVRSRLPEGKILNEKELEEIGYQFILIERVS